MLSGKTALITGSTSGIGLAIARKLASKGAKIMLNGMGNPDDIEKIRLSIAAEFGVEVCFNGADLTKPDQIATLISDAHERLGGLDILVNNAGIQFVSPIEDFPIEKWDAIIALNLSSAFHTTRLSFKEMKAKGWGRIVNIASAHALVASPFKAAYVAAKHGIAGLTKTIALEGAEHGITCNAICPGYVLTPLVEKQIPDTAKARGITEEEVVKNVLLAAQPTKKFVETDDIAELVVFLCSDAGRSITGSLQSIDGGWTAA
ncbi:3-hydroxybutyrate dehydrogenase [Asticcacaulis sp. YBE204]|uniref:3-hydroxybutyrate dehydrogenase n=1 Tax=Asticcacaulis sp. YBE204 TaxID=1282363 RepID=UPI0003C3CE8B|nr:3-hydroxybutyrate dehydrogenase [Asticcacaulis sp. YBE204]ESQ81290.1 cytochrome C biogenesis protein CcmE [Asticcacaulis sp. YBE204]